MSNSTDKMDVQIVQTEYGKEWVLVTLKRSRSFLPSFEDLHRIINPLAECEDRKYPDGEGRNMVKRFLTDCVYTKSYDELAKKYHLPIRSGNNIINSNGAKLIPTVEKKAKVT